MVTPGWRPVTVVAPGWRPVALVTPGWRPVALVTPGRRPVALVTPGRRPVTVVAPGRRPVALVAPGRWSVTVVAPGAVTVLASGTRGGAIVPPRGTAASLVSPCRAAAAVVPFVVSPAGRLAALGVPGTPGLLLGLLVGALISRPLARGGGALITLRPGSQAWDARWACVHARRLPDGGCAAARRQAGESHLGAQLVGLSASQGAHRPQLEALYGDPSEGVAPQLGHLVAYRLEHALDLVVTALVDDEPDPAVVGVVSQQLDRRGRRRLSVAERYPLGELREREAVDVAPHLGAIHLEHLVAWVQQPLGQLTVVGDDQRTLGVPVQAPDRVRTRHVAGQQILDGRAPLRVVQRGDDAGWLVEQQIHRPRPGQGTTVYSDAVPGRVHALPLLGHDLAVDFDPAGRDELLAAPARSDAGRSQDLVQAVSHACLPRAGGRAPGGGGHRRVPGVAASPHDDPVGGREPEPEPQASGIARPKE